MPRRIKGKPVKYESPRGQPNRVYFPPGIFAALESVETDLLLTEGEKKSLAANQFGFPCLGLVGVYGWKDGRADRLLPDLERINWHARKVYIGFDSDITDKAEVQEAEARLAAHLMARGADVRCVRLPAGPVGDDGKPAKVGRFPRRARPRWTLQVALRSNRAAHRLSRRGLGRRSHNGPRARGGRHCRG
jgi:hypothetical protein